jgi:hypothetical protein
LLDHVLHYHFYHGLNKEVALHLDIASEGSFSHKIVTEGKAILEKILENTPYTSIFDEFPKEEKEIEPSPEPKDKESFMGQEKEVLIAKSQLLQSQNLAKNTLREEEILPLESSDLFNTDGLDFQFHKRPSGEYNSNPLQKGSLIKCPYSQWEEFEDGISNDAIEEQPYHTKNPICCPIIFIDDTNSRLISKPIHVFEDPLMLVLFSLMMILEIH